MPALKGNKNAMKNGTRIERRRLTIGEMPKEMLSARREARQYRRALEAEVERVKGKIDMLDAHSIDTASAGTAHAAICRWLLRHRIGDMSTGDILACSKTIIAAKQARDAAVRQLGLDAPPPAPWTLIDITPPPAVQEAAVATLPAECDAKPAEPDATRENANQSGETAL